MQNVAKSMRNKPGCDFQGVTCSSPGAACAVVRATLALAHRLSGEWGRMSATADVHQYLAANIPDRQQLRGRVAERLAFEPDWLNREPLWSCGENFSVVSNTWFVGDGKVLVSNRLWSVSQHSPGQARNTTWTSPISLSLRAPKLLVETRATRGNPSNQVFSCYEVTEQTTQSIIHPSGPAPSPAGKVTGAKPQFCSLIGWNASLRFGEQVDSQLFICVSLSFYGQ